MPRKRLLFPLRPQSNHVLNALLPEATQNPPVPRPPGTHHLAHRPDHPRSAPAPSSSSAQAMSAAFALWRLAHQKPKHFAPLP